MAIEREVGDQPLEFAILLAQLPQLAQLAQAQARVFLLPDVKGRLADAILAANVAHPGAALRLPQRPQDLLLAVALLRHSPCPPQAAAEDHTSSPSLNLHAAYF